MIRRLRDIMFLTYSQTLNGLDVNVANLNIARKNHLIKWAIFGKQNWRCGMNQTGGQGA